MAESIIIEFSADTSGLQPAVDKLEALGTIDQKTAQVFKQTNAELKKKEQSLTSVATSTKKASASIDQLRTSALKESQVIKMSADEFKKTGLTLEQLVTQVKKQGEATATSTTETVKHTEAQKTLKKELIDLKEQMGQLKAKGQDNTEQYRILAEQAGKYRDVLGDVGKEINKNASDTRKLDTVIELGQGIAASFAVAQGAAALFGADEKELQETLLKVTSAMAVLNGLQTIGNLLQKESNIIRLVTLGQQKLQVVQTNLQTAAQSKNVIVSGTANVAMKILNATMKANPALLLVTAFAALAGALVLFSGKTKQAANEVELLNIELERQNDLVNNAVSQNDFQTKIELANAKKRGASEKELNEITLNGLRRNEQYYTKSIQTRISTAQRLFPELGKITVKSAEEAAAGLRKLQIIESNLGDNITADFKQRLEQGKSLLTAVIQDFKNLATTTQDIKLTGVEFDADAAEKLRQKQKEAAEKRKQDLEKQIEDEKKARHKGFEDFVALTEVQLLAAEKGSEQELELQKQKLRATLQLNLDNEELTKNQRLLLVKQYFKDREQLEKDFYQGLSKIQTENTISQLNADLQSLNISAQEKEALTVDLLNRQRDLELSAVEGNKAKEKEINAKFDREIADQSVAIFRAGLEEEERIRKAQFGKQNRKDAATSDDPNADITDRISAIDRLKDFELESINKRKAQNQQFLSEHKISQKEAEATAAELADQEAQAIENAEGKKQKAYKDTDEQKKALEQEQLQLTIETARQSLDIISQFAQQQNDTSMQNLQLRRNEVTELRDAGALTEREAIARMKRLDQEEKKIKRDQAIRDKNIAIFQAVINTADAVIKAYSTTGPIAGSVLAAIVGAIGAAQIALIASKPIPKFFTGKKNSYQGFGEVGDRGAELVETNGRMWVAEKPTITWLGKKDIVYNHEETKKMLNKPMPVVDKKVMAFDGKAVEKVEKIDYERIGKELGKHIAIHKTEITEKGIVETVKQGNSYTEYLDKRRKF